MFCMMRYKMYLYIEIPHQHCMQAMLNKATCWTKQGRSIILSRPWIFHGVDEWPWVLTQTWKTWQPVVVHLGGHELGQLQQWRCVHLGPGEHHYSVERTQEQPHGETQGRICLTGAYSVVTCDCKLIILVIFQAKWIYKPLFSIIASYSFYINVHVN